jgi:hypothetical protein
MSAVELAIKKVKKLSAPQARELLSWLEKHLGSDKSSIQRGRARQVLHATRDLTDHLDALAAQGLTFDAVKKENVPPCRF